VKKTRQNEKSSRRITPDLIAFYIKRGHELRAEYYRNMWRTVWAWLTTIGRC
jgi:hypothetical protein